MLNSPARRRGPRNTTLSSRNGARNTVALKGAVDAQKRNGARRSEWLHAYAAGALMSTPLYSSRRGVRTSARLPSTAPLSAEERLSMLGSPANLTRTEM